MRNWDIHRSPWPVCGIIFDPEGQGAGNSFLPVATAEQTEFVGVGQITKFKQNRRKRGPIERGQGDALERAVGSAGTLQGGIETLRQQEAVVFVVTQGQKINGAAVGLRAFPGTHMQRNEDIFRRRSAALPGALPQGDGIIAIARQVKRRQPLHLEDFLQTQGQGQGQILLLDALGADRAGIIAAVAGIDDNLL